MEKESSQLLRGTLSGLLGAGSGAASGCVSELVSGGSPEDRAQAALSGALVGGTASGLLRGAGNRLSPLLGAAAGVASSVDSVRAKVPGFGRSPVSLQSAQQGYYAQDPAAYGPPYQKYAQEKVSMTLDDIAIMEKVSGINYSRLETDDRTVVQCGSKYHVFSKEASVHEGTYDSLSEAKTAQFWSGNPSQSGFAFQRGLFGGAATPIDLTDDVYNKGVKGLGSGNVNRGLLEYKSNQIKAMEEARKVRMEAQAARGATPAATRAAQAAEQSAAKATNRPGLLRTLAKHKGKTALGLGALALGTGFFFDRYRSRDFGERAGMAMQDAVSAAKKGGQYLYKNREQLAQQAQAMGLLPNHNAQGYSAMGARPGASAQGYSAMGARPQGYQRLSY